MDLTLLSGVVRNRRMASAISRTQSMNIDGNQEGNRANNPVAVRIFQYLRDNNICRKFTLRVHKFSFQWDLVLHFAVCIFSLFPFFFTGDRLYSLLPVGVWAFYHILFLLYPRQANLVIPGFGRLKHSFKSTMEDFFSPKLLPVLSFSFLLVTLSLAVTGHRLGGPPLCYSTCGVCLSSWKHAVPLTSQHDLQGVDAYRYGCGYLNGKEMLGFYTMAQTSFTLFVTVMLAMSICLAWRIAEEENEERNHAEDWLKQQSLPAYELRNALITQCGSPASSIRPEGSATWVFFGIVAALSFTLLGWHNWYVLPPSKTATLLILLNLLTICMTTLILHLGFFGRIIALYKRNYLRVEFLSRLLDNMKETEIDHWWNCRNFVLNDDLSLEYDIGGLAVSATFIIVIMVFFILIAQIVKEGSHIAMLEPPGSYCAYACMYITSCLIKIFTLATNTFEEQHRHILKLQQISSSLALRSQSNMMSVTTNLNGDQFVVQAPHTPSAHWAETNLHSNNSFDEYGQDDGPFFIDGHDVESNHLMLNNNNGPNSPYHSKYSPNPRNNLSSAATTTTLMMSPRANKNRVKKLETTPNPPDNNNNPSNNNTLPDFNAIVKDNLQSFQLINHQLKNSDFETFMKANMINNNANNNHDDFFSAIDRSLSRSNEEDLDKNNNQPKNNFYFPETVQEANQPLLSSHSSERIGGSHGDEKNAQNNTNKLSLVNPMDMSSHQHQQQQPSSTRKTKSLLTAEDLQDSPEESSSDPLLLEHQDQQQQQLQLQQQSNAQQAIPSSPSKYKIPRPVLSRQQSNNLESSRMAIAEIISQIRHSHHASPVQWK